MTIMEFPANTPNSGVSGITVGPDGNLWFAENAVNQVARITPDGSVTQGSVTEFPLSVNAAPIGITAGPDGNLWFAERGVNRIGRIRPDGTGLAEFGGLTPNSGASLITAGPDGNLWFVEQSANRIGRITVSGLVTGEFAVPNAGPIGITVGPDGNLWFTEFVANRIGRITPLGTPTEFSAGMSPGAGPYEITTGPDGNLWFTENGINRVGRISPTGTITEFPLGPAGSNPAPTGITAGPDGNLWVSAPGNNSIIETNPSGAVIAEFSIPTPSSSPIIMTASQQRGMIAFSEGGGNKVGQLMVADAALSASGTAVVATEGVAFSLPVASVVDFDPNGQVTDFTATITWGDGQISAGTITLSGIGSGGQRTFTVAGTNTYADQGIYPIAVAIRDSGGSTAIAKSTAAVVNVAPTPAITGAPASSPEGTTISLTGSATDAGPADTLAGFTFLWRVNRNGGAYVSGSGPSFNFTPDDNGIYGISLSATDKDGGTGTASTTITVTNMPPTAAVIGAPASRPEGTAISLGSSVTDPGSVDTAAGFTHAWSVTRNGAAFATGAAANFSFTPNDNGTYAVTLLATDKDGGTSPAASATITVGNAAPTANAGGLYTGTAGTTITFNGSATDPSSVDAVTGFTYRWDFGDGNSGTGRTPDHSYAIRGTYTATLTATDKDGGTSSPATATVTVQPVVIVHRSTVGVYDPSTARWYLRNSNDSGGPDLGPFAFGAPGLIPLTGDYIIPDGREGIALYNPATSSWILTDNGKASDFFPFGGPGGLPVTIDLNGDGKDGIGLYNNGVWTIGDDTVVSFAFGVPGMIPVAGDFTGKHRDGVGFFDPAHGTWYLTDGNQYVAYNLQFGAPGWKPVVGDWDGTGKDSIGAVDPSTGTWFLRDSITPGPVGFKEFAYGAPGWLPVVGDWTGPAAQAELAAALPPPESPPAGSLAVSDLMRVRDAALARFAAAGLDSARLDRLRGVAVVLADLPGRELGLEAGNTVWVDADAAGYGWFADPTRLHDEQFTGSGPLVAPPGSAAVGRMDLLTVLEHEYGHTLGLPDRDAAGHANDLMADTLDPGVRRLFTLDALFADQGP